jgi:hypothetical protein
MFLCLSRQMLSHGLEIRELTASDEFYCGVFRGTGISALMSASPRLRFRGSLQSIEARPVIQA